MQGWSPDFIPRVTAEAIEEKLFDRVIPVGGPAAIETSMALARKEGIFAGITAGATLAGALKLAAESPKGTVILAMLPDTGERYLSTPLFADIAVEMDAEEEAISLSSPTAQLASKPAA
jgi:cysteine synthase A